MSLFLIVLKCLVCTYAAAWLTRQCNLCCKAMCIHVGFLALFGFIFSSAALCAFTQFSKSIPDPTLCLCITVYLNLQTASCFVTLIISAVGYRMCEWLFDKMEILVPRIRNLIMRFIQQNWKELFFSLILFINVQIYNYMSMTMDFYQIVSALLHADDLVQPAAEL